MCVGALGLRCQTARGRRDEVREELAIMCAGIHHCVLAFATPAECDEWQDESDRNVQLHQRLKVHDWSIRRQVLFAFVTMIFPQQATNLCSRQQYFTGIGHHLPIW